MKINIFIYDDFGELLTEIGPMSENSAVEVQVENKTVKITTELYADTTDN
jgi:hypothetical protein